MSKFQRIKGMRDFLPSDAAKLRHVEAATRDVAGLYGFAEIITPLIEHYDLLAVKSGEEIKARMYVFNDLAGRKIALRPEFTASIARLMATTLRNEPKPIRLFSTGTLYRYDEPQFGRYREFWQSNYEIFGSKRPEADVEILSLTHQLMRKLEVRRFWLKIGDVGILRGLLTEEEVEEERQNRILQLLDAKRWEDALKTAKSFKVSTKGIATLKKIFAIRDRDPLKVLQKTKKVLRDYESGINAAENLEEIVDLCKRSSDEMDILVEPRFARGLEYYTGMIFEVFVPEMDISLGGGGRYDKLVEMFGGEPTPAIGVAHGLDRISLALEKQNTPQKILRQIVALVPIGEKAVLEAVELASQLRERGIRVEMEIMGRTVSRALQDADRREASHAIIMGPKEIAEQKVMLRDLRTRQQRLIDVQELFKVLER